MTIHHLDDSINQLQFIMNIKHTQQVIQSKASKHGNIVKPIIQYKEFSSNQPCIFYSTDDPYSINLSVQDKQTYYTEELKMRPTIFIREFMNIVKDKLEKDNIEFELKQIKDRLSYSYNIDSIEPRLNGAMEQIIPTTNSKLDMLKNRFRQLHSKYSEYIDIIAYLQDLIHTKHEYIVINRNKLYEYKFKYITKAKLLHSQVLRGEDDSILFQYYKTKLLLENYSEPTDDIGIGSLVKLKDRNEYGIVITIDAKTYKVKLDIGKYITVPHNQVNHKKSIETLLREFNSELENDFEIPLLDLYTFLNQKGYHTCMEDTITVERLHELESRPYLVTTFIDSLIPKKKLHIREHKLSKRSIKFGILPPLIITNYNLLIGSGESIRLSPLNGDSLYYCVIDQLIKHNIYPMDADKPGDGDDSIKNKYKTNQVHIKGQIGDITIVDVVYHKAMIQLRHDIVQIYKDNQDLIIDGDTTLGELLSDNWEMPFIDYLSRLQISATVLKDGYRGISGNHDDIGVLSVLFNINIDLIEFEDGKIDHKILEIEDSKQIYTIHDNTYNTGKPIVTIKLAELGDGYYVSLE